MVQRSEYSDFLPIPRIVKKAAARMGDGFERTD